MSRSASLKTAPARWRPGPRPAWFTGLDTIGDTLESSAALVALDADSLLAAAREPTGLDDFGGDSWREGFDVLIDAIEREAGLHTVGRLLTRAEIVRLLQNRLRIIDTLARHPEIEQREITAPIFITGTARSGTSILHELLALDPAHRSPAAWEVLYSVPPPERASHDTDPRIAIADRDVSFWHEIAPEYSTMHRNTGALPHECIFLMAHEFASDHFSGVLQIPSYARWLVRSDPRPAFRFHRRMLQLLGWRCGPEQWLLKAPSHLAVLPALFSIYPDARVVLTHRDPARTVPSTISLMATLRHMRRDDVDVDRLAAQLADGMALGLDAVMHWRAQGEVPDDRFYDLRYADLMADPVGALRRLYASWDRELDDATAQRVERYLAARPREQHGPHRYDLSTFGIDADALRARYARYRAQYDVPEE